MASTPLRRLMSHGKHVMRSFQDMFGNAVACWNGLHSKKRTKSLSVNSRENGEAVGFEPNFFFFFAGVVENPYRTPFPLQGMGSVGLAPTKTLHSLMWAGLLPSPAMPFAFGLRLKDRERIAPPIPTYHCST